MTGFEDGVVRLLELYDAKGLHNNKGDAHIRLKQAFKPHNGPVTSVAYECNGKILATGVSALFIIIKLTRPFEIRMNNLLTRLAVAVHGTNFKLSGRMFPMIKRKQKLTESLNCWGFFSSILFLQSLLLLV